MLAGDIFMHEMHLTHPAANGQPEFTYGSWASFTDNIKEYKNLKKRGIHGISIKTN